MKNRRYFSLIELLIVIGIMGALAALILPAFSDTESAAKDTACDYNQAGTLRYLNMFYSANGVYPTGFHTGGSQLSWGATAEDPVVLTTCGTYNFGEKGCEDVTLGKGGDADLTESLVSAGIVSLAYGQGANAGVEYLTGDNAANAITAKKVLASQNGITWTEELDPVTGEVATTPKEPLTFRGVNLARIAYIGANGAAETQDKIFRAEGESDFVIMPFYVAPSIDWEHYYSDGPNDSKVKIALAGKCPWGEDGQARYYIAFFKVYTDGTPAKLLCTSCPDCGILEANAF